jgi:hypothetical protein
MSEKIAIPRENLPAVIGKAFDLSSPQGLGFLHYQPGGIPDDILQKILQHSDNAPNPYLRRIGLDYVEGRAVKLTIHHSEEDGFYLEDRDGWFDHSADAWNELKSFVRELPNTGGTPLGVDAE